MEKEGAGEDRRVRVMRKLPCISMANFWILFFAQALFQLADSGPHLVCCRRRQGWKVLLYKEWILPFYAGFQGTIISRKTTAEWE